MKTFCFTTMIGVLLLICANWIQAQPVKTQLHQIELKKPDNEITGINAFQRLQDFENFYAFSPLVISSSISQPIQSDDNKLNLTDLGWKIENTVSFTTSNSTYEKIQATGGQKISVKATILIINGDTLEPEEISTRGQISLYYRRKSYNISLKSEALFRHGKRSESLKKLFVISLSMDKNYSCNRLAFEMMEAAQLFHLFYSYCELRINGQSEGICMVTDKFSIIPWDYDDLFSVAPHEGYAESRKFLGNKLFFSAEDLFDKKIVTDPYLYKIYLIQLGELMNHLSTDVLKRVFENTYAELYPYYSDNEIISKSEYDLYTDDNLIKLKSDLLSVYEQLIIYRNYFLKYLIL